MITVPEFSAAADRHARRVIRWFLRPLVLLLLVACITCQWLFDPTPWLRAHVHPDAPTWLALPTLVGLSFAVVVLAAWPIHALARRDRRLVCHHCNRGLYRSRSRVVAARKCPRCDREILADSSPEPPVLTREEYKRLSIRFWRSVRACVLLFGFIFLVSPPVALGCEALVAAGWMSHFVSECIAAVMIVATFTLMSWGAVGALRFVNAHVTCRQCG